MTVHVSEPGADNKILAEKPDGVIVPAPELRPASLIAAMLDWRVAMLLFAVLLTLAWAGAWAWGLIRLVLAFVL